MIYWLGASLTKTSTTNWEESTLSTSDFNQVAAKVFGEIKKKMVEEAKRKHAAKEAERAAFVSLD